MLRITLNLLFKASLPLLFIAGTLSYGSYLRGGNPLATLNIVASSALDGTLSRFDAFKQRALGSVSLLKASSDNPQEISVQDKTRVYTWLDEEGITHYSSEEPSNGRAQSILIDPNVNLVAPVVSPKKENKIYADSNRQLSPASMGAINELNKGLPAIAESLNQQQEVRLRRLDIN